MQSVHAYTNLINDPAFLVDLFNRIDVGFSIFCLEDLTDVLSLRWVSSNAKAARILNLPVKDYFGKRLADIFPQLVKSGRLEVYADVVRSQIERDLPEVVTDATEYTATRVYSVKAFPLLNQCVGIRFEDVTEVKQSHRENERHAERLQVLSDISKELAAVTHDYQTLVEMIAQRLSETIRNACLVRLYDDNSKILKTAAFHDPDPLAYDAIQMLMTKMSPRGDEYLTGEVMRTGKALHIPALSFDSLRHLLTPEAWAALERTGVLSLVMVPLRVHEENIGILYLIRHDPALPPFSDDDLRLVEDLAERAALAIENARLVNELEKRVLERTRDLTQVNQELENSLMHEIEVSELKTRFITMVSHEFRTPLSVIQLAAETVKKYRGRLSDEVVDEKLELVRHQVQHLSELLEGILFINRAERVGVRTSKTAVDVKQLCAEVLQNLATLHDKRQGIILREFGDCKAVYSDRMLLQQILLNLLSNAIKYSPPNTPIQINIYCEEERLTLQVRDQGIGIPKSDLQNLFHMFYRASNVEQTRGIGVGLVVVKQAVDALEGSIMVESEVNKGTSFTIVIPTAA
ncbi:MAG: ATP-binding protein [Chloroflexota bacterium]|nr:ATP-binding protein [Chloroflexota bacterium]